MKKKNVSESLPKVPLGSVASQSTWDEIAPRLLKTLREHSSSRPRMPQWEPPALTRSTQASHLEPHAWLKILIAYEDFATGHRAMNVCENLISQLGREFQFRTCFWKFEILRVPKLKAIAEQDADEADLIMVSAHGDGELPVEVRSWIAGFHDNPAEGAKALVALLDEADETAEKDFHIHSYLEKFAQQARFDFFSHSYPVSRTSSGVSSINFATWAEANHVVIGELPHRPTPIRQWGINE